MNLITHATVVAPSGDFSRAELALGLSWWSQRLTVTDRASGLTQEGYFSAEDSLRAEAFCAALEDPLGGCLLCARGGYGAMRLIEGWGARMLSALARDPRVLVGYSDVTALHGVWHRAGLRSVHGPMVAATGRGTLWSEDLWRVLRGEAPRPWEGLGALAPGRASGPAVGGNLAVLTSLLGTRWMPSLAGCVLFLEDVGERPYRLDRMITSLRMAGALDSVAAVVLGDFVRCDPAADGVTVEGVLRNRFGDLGVPVVTNAPFGHGERSASFVLGARVDLFADEGKIVFCEGL